MRKTPRVVWGQPVRQPDWRGGEGGAPQGPVLTSLCFLSGAPASGDHPQPLRRVQQRRRQRRPGAGQLGEGRLPRGAERRAGPQAVAGQRPGGPAVARRLPAAAEAERERRGEPEGGVQQHGEHPSGGEDLPCSRLCSSPAQWRRSGLRPFLCMTPPPRLFFFFFLLVLTPLTS